jgi:predicted RNA-binding protein
MEDVARIEAEANGYWLVDLFGKRKFVEGRILSIDLIDDHFIILEGDKAALLRKRHIIHLSSFTPLPSVQPFKEVKHDSKQRSQQREKITAR